MSDSTGPDVRLRAAIAAGSVDALFGHRLGHLPGTALGAVRWPRRRRAVPFTTPWHYWWQAHYLDCLVDAAWREHRDGLPAASLPHAHRLLTGIWLKNLLRFPNAYYDDMAWLALAADRLDEATRAVEGRSSRRCGSAVAALGPHLVSAMTDDIGGGLFWNRRRDFKNTPATAPAALFFARTGDRERARALVTWLRDRLLDAGSGLYLDGLRPRGGTLDVVRDVYTYNQGPVLGALLELGEPDDLEAAARLVRAVAAGLTRVDGDRRVLLTHGEGDGGLFTGILTRYLAAAAVDARLDEDTRRTAAALVRDTADGFWSGRRRAGVTAGRVTVGGDTDGGSTAGADDAGPGAVLVFPPDPAGHHTAIPSPGDGSAVGVIEPGAGDAAGSGPSGGPSSDPAAAVDVVELSTQVQAWMTLEAAALVEAPQRERHDASDDHPARHDDPR